MQTIIVFDWLTDTGRMIIIYFFPRIHGLTDDLIQLY